MGDEPKQLHVALFPFMAPGHKIPILHIARLFAARSNVTTTILTTPLNVPTFTAKHGLDRVPSIDVEVFKFPSTETGIPEGCEDVEQALCLGIMDKFLLATEKFREQLENYLEKTRPNCLVADMFFSWATESAAKFNIPVLVFHTTGFFTLCAGEVDRLHQSSTTKNVSSDNEEFVLPSLPHEVKMTKSQFPKDVEEAECKERLKRVQEHDLKSYGAIVNTFYELEPEYVEFFRTKLDRRGWHIGPVCLSNLNVKKDQNGNEIEYEVECLKWLNSKKSCSVVYICFGSAMVLRPPQIMEIAMALDLFEQEFIWVMPGDKGCRWLPPPEMERMIREGKGLLIQGWAPQVRILEHEAVGAFVTHCGWNSTLEAISAGVPMITWPLFAEQFFNEKLVTSILNIGVPVGAKKYCDRVSNSEEDIIKRDKIMKALEGVMMGSEAQERRKKAKKLKEMAWKAMEEGGSSYNDLTRLIDELRAYKLNY